MLDKFIYSKNGNLIFNGHYMEIFIPQSYFDSKLSENHGTSIRTFGVLNAIVYDNNNKKLFRDLINLPTSIFIYPSETEDRVVNLLEKEGYGEATKYRVAKFYKGDIVMPDSIQRNSSNVELFIQLMCGGKLDSTIPYDRLMDIWEKNLEINNIRLNVSTTILGIIISEIYRDKKNPNVKFGKLMGQNPKISPYAYRTANIREICSRNSTFAALTFEDMDAMITTSLNMKNYNKKQVESPIEKIIKM